jgi:hypothetical protein
MDFYVADAQRLLAVKRYSAVDNEPWAAVRQAFDQTAERNPDPVAADDVVLHGTARLLSRAYFRQVWVCFCDNMKRKRYGRISAQRFLTDKIAATIMRQRRNTEWRALPGHGHKRQVPNDVQRR